MTRKLPGNRETEQIYLVYYIWRVCELHLVYCQVQSKDSDIDNFRKAICPICPDVSMDGLDRLLFIKSGDTFAESILVMWSFLQLLELEASVY